MDAVGDVLGLTREKRQQAYSKILEGQRHLSDLRSSGNAETLRLARQAFQDAAALDPNLAEAHTALAEIAFYYPPQDLEAAARESAVDRAVAVVVAEGEHGRGQGIVDRGQGTRDSGRQQAE